MVRSILWASRLAMAPALAVVLSNCSSSGSAAKPDPKPTTRAAIVDRAPYWCGIVPKSGLQVATGRSQQDLTENSVPAPDAAPTIPIRCSINQRLMLFERATGATARRYLAGKPPVGSEPHTRRIPQRLGTGAASGAGSQWHAYSYFRCGKITSLFTISIDQVARNRDTDADLIRLLDIAQHRYSGAAGCRLTATPPSTD